jgi:hypothetical protein
MNLEIDPIQENILMRGAEVGLDAGLRSTDRRC